MGPGRRGSARAARAHRAALAAGCVGVAAWALCCRRFPAAAQAPPEIKKLELSSGPSGAKPRGCDAALAAGYKAFQSSQADWVAALEAGRLIPSFGKVAAAAEQKAFAAFDAMVEQDSALGRCTAQRAALHSTVQKEVWAVFLAQRQLAEQATGDALSRQLIQLMKRRGAPLRIQEKVDMLREAAASYRRQVQALLPEWAASQGDPEEAEAERRLGELQFRIEDSAGGRNLRGLWERDRAKRLMSERAKGFSLSLDPALRVMIRPEGLGNLQVFSTGPVGPPNQPATVNVGVMNDGSMADVYREHPVPPKLSVQPAVKVNLNVR